MLRDGASAVDGDWAGVVGADAGVGGADTSRVGAARFEQLHRRLKRIVKARGALDAQEAAALREAQTTKMWRYFGCSSLVDYMEREMGYTARAALERLRVANAIEELPVIADAMDQGSLSFSGARELTRIVTPETQEAWLDAAADKSSRQIEEMVRGHKPGDLPSDPPDPALRTKVLRFEVKLATAVLERQAKKKLEKERGERLDDDAFIRALFLRVLERPHGEVAHDGDEGQRGDVMRDERDREPSGLTRDDHQRREINATRPGGRDSEVVTAASHDVANGRSRYQIAVTVCRECKRGWHDAAGESVELSPAAIECARCDGVMLGALDGSGIARAKQKIPPALRRAVLARDRHRCAVPGCRSTNLDAHHILELSKGGKHELANLITLCEAHHLALHEGALLLEGAPPNVMFTRRTNNNFNIATRAIETAAALRRLGYRPDEVKAAVTATRTHVGEYELSLEQWIPIALSKYPRPGS